MLIRASTNAPGSGVMIGGREGLAVIVSGKAAIQGKACPIVKNAYQKKIIRER